MTGLSHQDTHNTPSQVLQPTLHQALLWIQSNPPLFQQAADPLFLDHPLPANTQPLCCENLPMDLLADQINKKGNPLLGIFYETLWQFLLNRLKQTRILAANLQANDDQSVTVGEYDLLYRCHGQIFHRELAVKFYLGVPGPDNNTSPWHRWVGPGLRDRLDWKMTRLLHHQAILSDTSAGQKALLAQHIAWPVNKEILVQGRLFYPLINDNKIISLSAISHSDYASHAAAPQYSNRHHWRGYWLTASQLVASTRNTSLSYQIPGKWQWLNDWPDSLRLNRDQLLQRLTRRPTYIRAIDRSDEQLHLFVVPDDWPGRALQVAQKPC